MQDGMEKNILKTGTTTVGIICKDGVILAADRRMSAGYMIAGKKTEKIIPISEDVAVTTAGMVSDAQLLTRIIKAQIRLDVKAVNTSIQRDMASGNGIDVVTITEKGMKKVIDKEINTSLNI